MPDREKVIKGLEDLAEWFHQELIVGARIKEQTCLEARTLLKEQEAVEPKPLENHRYACGSCGNSLWVFHQRFCASCGRSVKWE